MACRPLLLAPRLAQQASMSVSILHTDSNRQAIAMDLCCPRRTVLVVASSS